MVAKERLELHDSRKRLSMPKSENINARSAMTGMARGFSGEMGNAGRRNFFRMKSRVVNAFRIPAITSSMVICFPHRRQP
jgi:hypothetical protein